MPSRSCTRSRTRSISCSTSWLVAPGLGDDEVGVPIADFRLADARALQPGLFDQHAGAHAARVLENAAGALMAQRLAGFLDDPLLLHPLGQLFGIILFELERAGQDDQFVERAFAIGKNQLFARSLDDLAGAGHERGLAGPLADVAAAAAGVAVQARRRSCRECRPGLPGRPAPRAPRSRWPGPAWRRRRPRRSACRP